MIKRLLTTARITKSLPSAESVRQTLSPKVQSLVQHYPSLLNLEVRWGEEDSFGHLNNVVYCRYVESGRLAYFEQVLSKHLTPKTRIEFMTGKGIGPIVKNVSITYRAPTWYPDTVTVACRIPKESLSKDRFIQEFIVVSHAQERIVADGTTLVVIYDYKKHCKTDIPQEILDAFNLQSN